MVAVVSAGLIPRAERHFSWSSVKTLTRLPTEVKSDGGTFVVHAAVGHRLDNRRQQYVPNQHLHRCVAIATLASAGLAAAGAAPWSDSVAKEPTPAVSTADQTSASASATIVGDDAAQPEPTNGDGNETELVSVETGTAESIAVEPTGEPTTVVTSEVAALASPTASNEPSSTQLPSSPPPPPTIEPTTTQHVNHEPASCSASRRTTFTYLAAMKHRPEGRRRRSGDSCMSTRSNADDFERYETARRKTGAQPVKFSCQGTLPSCSRTFSSACRASNQLSSTRTTRSSPRLSGTLV